MLRSNVERCLVPDRMLCANIRMRIDDRTVNVIVDYTYTNTGILPMAVWVKIKPNESTLDRELRSSGKAVSLLLQYGCGLKEIAETFTKDSIIGVAVNYLHKNIESILANEQPNKIPVMNTDPYKLK